MNKIMEDVLTKGNVLVNKIEIGDIHYEYDMGCEIKCEVISLPVKTDDGNWWWKSKCVDSDAVINYLVNPDYSHYAPNLYTNQAYMGMKRVNRKKSEVVVDDLARYEAVNGTKTLNELAAVIHSFADDEGLIEGRGDSFDAERMADACLDIAEVDVNRLTRKWGIRQQAIMVAKLYKK